MSSSTNHIESALKKGITIKDDGKVYQTVKSNRPGTDYIVKVNLVEAVE